jgi:hypothetical protein
LKPGNVIVTVNRHVIAANKKKLAEGADSIEAPFSVRSGRNGKPTYAVEVEFPAGARLVYNPYDPLKCGATVWLEADEVVLDL